LFNTYCIQQILDAVLKMMERKPRSAVHQIQGCAALAALIEEPANQVSF
jgi:hypothetical protein